MTNTFDGDFVAYYGRENEWKVYRVSDGALVCYRTRHNANGDAIGLDRVVTQATGITELPHYLDKHQPKKPRYNPYNDPNQQRIE